VATNILAITPVIGPALQKVVIGGNDYGHQTLTRFFAVHAGVIPATIVALIVAHIYLFRRHGITPKEPRRRPDAAFWPDQVLRDAVACLAVLLTVLFFIGRNHGAELGAPADPSQQFEARPEWYFLFLFQLLKYFPGGTEIWGAIALPALLMLALAAMPWIGRSKAGHRGNLAFLCALLGAVALLTFLAIDEDRRNPEYRAAVEVADRDAARAVVLAQAPDGIPLTGAVTLLHNDPLTQGPRLFAKNCASCHRYDGNDGLGGQPKGAPTASDLKGFASRAWLTGLHDPKQVAETRYFGGSKLKSGEMAGFVHDDVAGFSAAEKDQLQKALLALSAEAGLKAQSEADRHDAALIDEGRKLLGGNTVRCSDCHQFHFEDHSLVGPDLTGYGSRDWLIAFLNNPASDRFYGKANDRMPAFGADKRLTAQEIGLIVDWLRGEWYSSPR